jgi:hypothetical protein
MGDDESGSMGRRTMLRSKRNEMSSSTSVRWIRSWSGLGAAAAVLACGAGDLTSATARRARELGVLQVESSSLASSGSGSSADGTVEWIPTIGSESTPLLLPPQVIEAPDTVRAQKPFTVTVYTIGMDGCWRADGGDLDVRGDTIVYDPYDVHSGAPVCTLMTRSRGLQHSFSATFPKVGTGVLRVNGRRVSESDKRFQLRVMAERKVTVSP